MAWPFSAMDTFSRVGVGGAAAAGAGAAVNEIEMGEKKNFGR